MNRTYPFDIGAAEATFIWVTVEAKNCVVAKKFISFNKPAFDFWLFRSMHHAHLHVYEVPKGEKIAEIDIQGRHWSRLRVMKTVLDSI